jgi:hypothetical protein
VNSNPAWDIRGCLPLVYCEVEVSATVGQASIGVILIACVCVFLKLFIILHAPLLWSNNICSGGFIHYFHYDHVISTKITYSVYKMV